METVTDILVGDSAVIVECNDGDKQYKMEKVEDNLIESLDEDVPDTVREKLLEEGFTIDEYPRTVSVYLHDDAEPYDYRRVSEKTGLPEDNSLVERIAGIGYEVELTVKLESKSKAYITHFMGHELVEPKRV